MAQPLWNPLADVVTAATPLGALKADGLQAALATPAFDLFLGRMGGSLGEVSALALLLGAAFLLARGIIRWQTPVSFLATVAVFAGILV